MMGRVLIQEHPLEVKANNQKAKLLQLKSYFKAWTQNKLDVYRKRLTLYRLSSINVVYYSSLWTILMYVAKSTDFIYL